jgi:hypothetical protein
MVSTFSTGSSSYINLHERYLIFARHGIRIEDYPAIEKHLSRFKERLVPRPKNWKGKEWAGRKPGAYKWYEIQDTLENLPIRSIDFSNNADIDNHNRMVRFVDSALSLYEQFIASKSAAQKEVIQRQIDATNGEIDRLVYELYGLTEDEVMIVEGGRK